MLFGPTRHKIPALAVCGIDPEQVGRFRDVWVERDGDSADSVILALYTRNGGGNRQDYQDQIGYLHSLPTFVSDREETWAGFRLAAVSPINTDERWQTALAVIEGRTV